MLTILRKVLPDWLILGGFLGFGAWGLPLATCGQGPTCREPIAYEPQAVGDRWGVVALDSTGRQLVPAQYASARVLSPQLVAVQADAQAKLPTHGVVDLTGRVVVPLEYEQVYSAGCGFVQANRKGHNWLYDATGQVRLQADSSQLIANGDLNRVVVLGPARNYVRPIQLLELSTGKVLYRGRGETVEQIVRRTNGGVPRCLPFYEVKTSQHPDHNTTRTGLSRIVDRNGRELFDSVMWIGVGQRTIQLTTTRYLQKLVLDTNFVVNQALTRYRFEQTLQERYYVVQEGDRKGIVRADGTLVVPIAYRGNFEYLGHDCLLLRSKKEDTLSFFQLGQPPLHLLGYELFDRTYGDTTLNHNPLVVLNQRTRKYGTIDLLALKEVLPFVYDGLSYVSPTELTFRKDGESGYMSPQGVISLRLPGTALSLGAFHEGFAGVSESLPCSRVPFSQTSEKSFVIGGGGGCTVRQYNYLDRTGHRLLEKSVDRTWPFQGGVACVLHRENVYMIDRTGQPVKYPGGLRLDSYFTQGVAIVKRGKKVGLIRADGTLALEPIYEYIKTDDAVAPGPKLTKGGVLAALPGQPEQVVPLRPRK